jgi:shikimate kinase
MMQIKVFISFLLLPYCFAFISFVRPQFKCSRIARALHVSSEKTEPKVLNEEDQLFKDLRVALKGTNVNFVGMMGSGKSSTGELFARKLDYRYLDTDEIAEWMIEEPIADFFAKGQESIFRDVETKVLMELVQYTRLVVSTGGGIVMKKDNWGLLHHGIVVYLDVTPEDIYKRLTANPSEISKRPLLKDEDPLTKLKKLYDDRLDYYCAADVRVPIDITATKDEVTVQVANAIMKFIADNPPKWESFKKKREDFAVQAAARVCSLNLDRLFI